MPVLSGMCTPQVSADLRCGPSGSRGSDSNAAWAVLATLAHNLWRWTAILGGLTGVRLSSRVAWHEGAKGTRGNTVQGRSAGAEPQPSASTGDVCHRVNFAVRE